MKVCDTLKQLMLPVKTSLGKAAEKTSATVKKASQIALKILKALYTLTTYPYNCAKSFFDKRRKKPSESPKASDQEGSLSNPFHQPSPLVLPRAVRQQLGPLHLSRAVRNWRNYWYIRLKWKPISLKRKCWRQCLRFISVKTLLEAQKLLLQVRD